MKNNIILSRYFVYLLIACSLGCGVAFTSCSSTSHLPEDELLYRGIKRMDYGKWQRPMRTADSTGVITALADAYNTVEELLSGKGGTALPLPTTLTKEQLDSLKQADKRDEAAYNEAREEVEAVLAYAPNGSFMGSSYVTHPLPIRLWIYNRYVNSKSKFGRWMMNHFAANPVLISTVNPKVRASVARTTLRNHGYFQARVAHDTIPMRNPRKAKLTYQVLPGKLYHFDHVQYKQFPTAIDTVMRRAASFPLVHRGDPFKAATLDNERKRIAGVLRNNGFYYYRPEYVQFKADTLQQPFKVQLQILPNPATPDEAMRPYRVGRTFVRVLRNGDRLTTDTLPEQQGFTFAYSGGKKKPLMKPEAIRRFFFYREGDLYRQNVHDLWQQKMSESGLFSQVRAEYVLRDSTANCDTLDVRITATLDKPYDSKLEGRVTGKSNGQVGPGVSFSMTKINAFRGGETLGLDASASYEWQTGADLHGDNSVLNSYAFGASLHLTYPRIMFFGLGHRIGRRAISSTQFKLDARLQNRANYFGRVTFGARITYSFQHKRNIKHEFTPLRLDYEVQLHSTARFDSIIGANPTLAVSMHNQFIPSMEYIYNWRSRSGAQRTLTLNVKEAGNATSVIYAIAGKGFSQRNKSLFDVPFAQYLKASAQYTHQFRLTSRSCIATRAFLGAVYSYGNAVSAPYGDLFTIGGANSIRAFAMRSIGPGSYHPGDGRYSYITQTGDLKIELNAEYRFPIVGDLYGAAFVDAGNVWLLREDENLRGGKFNFKTLGNDIALGTGVGLRYDLDFLILRFDLGIGIHAPYDTGRAGYYNMPSFGKSLGYHFAIGYPF